MFYKCSKFTAEDAKTTSGVRSPVVEAACAGALALPPSPSTLRAIASNTSTKTSAAAAESSSAKAATGSVLPVSPNEGCDGEGGCGLGGGLGGVGAIGGAAGGARVKSISGIVVGPPKMSAVALTSENTVAASFARAEAAAGVPDGVTITTWMAVDSADASSSRRPATLTERRIWSREMRRARAKARLILHRSTRESGSCTRSVMVTVAERSDGANVREHRPHAAGQFLPPSLVQTTVATKRRS